MSEKFTAGPWEVFDKSRIISVMKAGSKCKEVVHWGGFDASSFPKQARANARLIASAPDLLAALEAILKVLDSVTENDDNVFYFNGRYCGQLEQPLDVARAALLKARGTEKDL